MSTTSLTNELIAQRARRIWENRGRPADSDMEIWLEAERQLQAEGLVTATPKSSANVTVRPARKRKVAADDIDASEVQERLNAFGDPGRRSATDANLP